MNRVNTNRDDEFVLAVGTLDLGNDVDHIGKFDDWDKGLMYQNVQSLNNKSVDIAMMLTVDNLNKNILCFTKHWLLEQMNVINIEQFRLVSKFCRETCASGGSSIFTTNTIQTKEVSCLSRLGSEKTLLMTELSDLGTILTCIYRLPDSDFDKFLCKLEISITKVRSKGKRLIHCGDLNVNFLQPSSKLEDLQNLLLMSSLTNTVKSPARVTGHTETLIDVILVNDTNNEKLTATVNVGYCDHLAQVLYIKTKKLPKGPINTCNRHLTDNSIAEYKYFLHKETWDEVLERDEPNTAVNL
jgi:hypothetical protein